MSKFVYYTFFHPSCNMNWYWRSHVSENFIANSSRTVIWLRLSSRYKSPAHELMPIWLKVMWELFVSTLCKHTHTCWYSILLVLCIELKSELSLFLCVVNILFISKWNIATIFIQRIEFPSEFFLYKRFELFSLMFKLR